jgi:hypothetical protein
VAAGSVAEEDADVMERRDEEAEQVDQEAGTVADEEALVLRCGCSVGGSERRFFEEEEAAAAADVAAADVAAADAGAEEHPPRTRGPLCAAEIVDLAPAK